MTRLTVRSLLTISALSIGAMAISAGEADAQSRSRYRNDPAVQARCIAAVQRALPGSHSNRETERNRTALYQACVRNGGTIPGRRRN